MSFVAVCLAILLWLVRPQDWLSPFAGFGFMQYTMLAAMYGLWRRPGGLQGRHFVQSPADWLVLAYLVWIVWTTGNWFATAKAIFPFAAFYFTTALALDTPKRLHTFLSCWSWGLAVMVVFAISTDFGFELAPGSADLTAQFEDRLTLNFWIFNNPNSLGHGAVALIPLAYVWFVWRRSGGSRVLGFAMIFLAGHTVYLTQSKGAYLCGAAAAGVCLMFKKPKILQVCLLVVIMTAGVTALKMLPRMESMNAQEEGIAARLLIWQMAHNAMVSTKTGEGWKVFQAYIHYDGEDIKKATHGSYVNVGADLGYAGLFLFIGILYANARTVLQARIDPDDVEFERCQRALLSLTTSFAASAWMIDKAYATDYFLLAGAVAAFHRLTSGVATPAPSEEQAETENNGGLKDLLTNPLRTLPGLPQPAVANGGMLLTESRRPEAVSVRTPGGSLGDSQHPEGAGWQVAAPYSTGRQVLTATGSEARVEQPGTAPGHYRIMHRGSGSETVLEAVKPEFLLKWRRLGLMDAVMISLAFAAALYIWEYIMYNFIAF